MLTQCCQPTHLISHQDVDARGALEIHVVDTIDGDMKQRAQLLGELLAAEVF